MPTRATRRFIRRLADEKKIPVYAFVDCDPYGIANIYRTLKVGSGNAAHINRFFCVPQAQYLGVTPQDILDFKLQDATHPLQEVDVKRAKDALKNDPFFQAHKPWQKAIEQMLKMGVRAEQQALAKWGLNFVIEEYLPRKLAKRKSVPALGTSLPLSSVTSPYFALDRLPMSERNPVRGRSAWGRLHVAVSLLFTCLLAVFVVRTPWEPILMLGDLGMSRFASFYLSQNVEWFPLPRIELTTDASFYPYGVSHAFLQWGFERDVQSSVLTGLFGMGPWFELYFTFSILVVAVGAYFMLRGEEGNPRATIVALAVSFGNYYIIRKFPVHMSLAVVHWTTLGILADYLLVKQHWLRRPWSGSLVLGRGVLLALSLGQDLGYIAGYGFTSFTLSSSWILLVELIRGHGRPSELLGSLGERSRATLLNARQRPRRNIGLALVGILAVWLYLPLTAGVLRDAMSLGAPTLAGSGSGYENPLRLLIPWLPGGFSEHLASSIEDKGERSGFHFSPGLSFLLAALAGLAFGFRRAGQVLPFVILFALCVFFIPSERPLFEYLPWFRFSRYPGRATAVFPVLLSVMALQIPPAQRWRSAGRGMACALLALFGLETVTAYRIIVRDREVADNRALDPGPEFFRTMEAVRMTPGEALFEWPFSIGGAGQMGSFHERLGGSSHFAEFHGKKLVGGYFGRLVPEMIAPLLGAGWELLFLPDGIGAFARLQRRDFFDSEWLFLEDFVAANDFAGLLLYTDLLLPSTVASFHERFGPSTATAVLLPGPGRIEFIPKPDVMRARVDPERGRSIALERPVLLLPLGRSMSLGAPEAEPYLQEGWAGKGPDFRAMYGLSASLAFGLEHPPAEYLLSLAAGSVMPVEIRLNGNSLGILPAAGLSPSKYEFLVPASSWQASNELRFEQQPSPASAAQIELLQGNRHFLDWRPEVRAYSLEVR